MQVAMFISVLLFSSSPNCSFCQLKVWSIVRLFSFHVIRESEIFVIFQGEKGIMLITLQAAYEQMKKESPDIDSVVEQMKNVVLI